LTIFFIITFDFFQFARNETLAWAARRASRSLTRRAFAALRARARERAESTAIAVRAGDALLRRRYFAAWAEAVGAQRVAKEVRLRGKSFCVFRFFFCFFFLPLDISVY
jgi:hypothetical protein